VLEAYFAMKLFSAVMLAVIGNSNLDLAAMVTLELVTGLEKKNTAVTDAGNRILKARLRYDTITKHAITMKGLVMVLISNSIDQLKHM